MKQTTYAAKEGRRSRSTRKNERRRNRASRETPPRRIESLHRTVGNRAVQSIVKHGGPDGGRETTVPGRGTDRPFEAPRRARSGVLSGTHRRSTTRSRAKAKAEAAYNAPSPQDDEKKVENGTGWGAVIGGGIGAVIGGTIGAVVGGPVGAGVGAVAGGLIGAGIGALVGSVAGGSGISWKPANYASDNANRASSAVEQPFDIRYSANRDEGTGVWRLLVDSIEGGIDIEVHTGGSRDPFASPPTTQAEARDAVTVMKGYYARGNRGSWHTEAASRAHEMHHYREWKCSSEHYWPVARAALESRTTPLRNHATEAQAIAAMRSGASGADAIAQSFRNISHQYWFTLSDSAGSRPYAAGQLELNNAVTHVQGLAGSRGWTVPSGTDSPSPEPPCYQSWLPYSP